MRIETYNNISTSERAVRFIVGMALIYSVVLHPGVLGAAAVLPLIAIYPILTGVIGWEPIYNVYAKFKQITDKTPVNSAHITHA